jgi:hypothetical protein
MAPPLQILLCALLAACVTPKEYSDLIDGATDGAADPGTVPEPGGEPGSEPSSEPGSEPGSEPAGEPGSEPSAEPGSEPSAEPLQNPAEGAVLCSAAGAHGNSGYAGHFCFAPADAAPAFEAGNESFTWQPGPLRKTTP